MISKPAPAAGTQSVAEWTRYAAFVRTPPEFVLAWHDAHTPARAWLVINSSRGGAAGGGTRMRSGATLREVTVLAKAMELKFAFSGPPIAGAKTGIDFDPADPRKAGVLERWYSAIAPILRERYGTGGDLNVDETRDVLPAFARSGLEHPQEGVIRGHLRPEASRFASVMQRMDRGVVAQTGPELGVAGLALSVADTVTGFGLATTVRRLFERRGRDLAGSRILLEGFGNVGAACALYLARCGARIVSISDARSTLVEPQGMDACGVEELIRRRQDKLLPADDPRISPAQHGRFWQPADIFVCAAVSHSVGRDTLDRLDTLGVEVIACGANQPFAETQIGSARIAQLADERFAVLPDILANHGMARAYSYLMQPDASDDAPSVFRAVAASATDALDDVLDRSGDGRRGLYAAALGLALDRISAD